MKSAMVLLSAVLFGLGLAIGGMLDPARVVGFLDFFGAWDPTLAFVMGGALCVNVLAHRRAAALERPSYDAVFHLPTQTAITQPLIVGSMLFGIGWAMAGYCPGPALTSLGSAGFLGLALVAAMAVGSIVGGMLQQQ